MISCNWGLKCTRFDCIGSGDIGDNEKEPVEDRLEDEMEEIEDVEETKTMIMPD